MSVTLFPLRFKIRGPRPASTYTLPLDFAYLPPPPNIFVRDVDGHTVPTTQRVWDGSAWFPAL